LSAPLGDVPRILSETPRKPLWLLPNLLSLDAPLVAVSWLHVFAKNWRLGYHPWEAYVVLALAVWSIYVADRLLDLSLLGKDSGKLEARHEFHRKYRKWFVAGLVVALVTALVLVVTKMPMTLYRHLFLGGVMVAGFFGLSMLSSQDPQEVPHTKNILAGITFAFGTAMTAHLYRWEYGIYDLLVSHELLSFAALCVLNISAIDVWEHSRRAVELEAKATDELMLTLPLLLLFLASATRAYQDVTTRPFHIAILTGAALLYLLNRNRSSFSMDALRVLADAAILAPVLVFIASSDGTM
jgi:hypothetical protein